MTDVICVTPRTLHDGGVIGVVLAAGLGARMGGAHVRRFRFVGCDDVISVVREGDEGLAAHVVVCSAADPTGSLRLALASMSRAEFVVITPVDAVPARVSTIGALVDACGAANTDAATPVHQGRGGHPIVVRRAALDALERHASLRDLLDALGMRRRRIDVDDAAVITDLDAPDDVVACAGTGPTFVR